MKFFVFSVYVLFLVIFIGNYTVEDKEIVEGIWKLFGVEVKRYIMIVFIRKDELGDDFL